MKKTIYIAIVLTSALLLSNGCSTVGKPSEIDPATGKIKSQSVYGEIKAKTVVSERIPVQKYRPLILTLGAKFFKEQTIKLGYFDTVVNRQDMEQLLIKEGKSDIVTDVTNLLSWKKIADNYKPFFVLKPDIREEGRTSYAQLKVIQADTAAEVFVAEIKMDFMWKGVNDDTVFYPLYNEFIDWLNANK